MLTEFGVEFSHRGHASGRSDETCATCHSGLRGGPDRRLGQGHRACGDKACHGQGAAAPPLAQCESCHREGLLSARDEHQAQERWSVLRFVHDGKHAEDKGGARLSCERCHVGASAAESIAAIASPKKNTCRPCHDGNTAFKMTGHSCGRCHVK
jgi:hypothetical protein